MSQKVAYVTGGMGGIGTAICQRLHNDGYTVIAGCGPTRDFKKWIDEQKDAFYYGRGKEDFSRFEAFAIAAKLGYKKVIMENYS